MIESHRHHRFGPARLECDRWIFTDCVVRRVWLHRMYQDERFTVDVLGRGTEDRARAQLMIVLRGEMHATVQGRSTVLPRGTVLGTDKVEDLVVHRGDELTLSIDWTSERSVRGRTKLGGRALATIEAASHALGDRDRPRTEIAKIVSATHAALAAEGLDVAPLRDRAPIDDADSEDQRFMAVLDNVLSDLASGPAAADWESRTGATRRTLTRRAHAFHDRYRLFGLRRQTDWRAVRDFYRLLISSIYLTEEDATVASVARAAGYRSPAALCHAYAQVGLPPPGKLRALVAAA